MDTFLDDGLVLCQTHISLNVEELREIFWSQIGRLDHLRIFSEAEFF